jgi:hypothetical protein
MTKYAELLPPPRVGVMLRLGVNLERSSRSSIPLAAAISALMATTESGVSCRLVARRSEVTMMTVESSSSAA